MQRMVGREAAADLEVADDLGVERFRERDALVPAVHAARHPPHQDDRVLRGLEHRGGLLDELGRRRWIGLRHEARGVDRRERLGELGLLHLGVEVDVDRTHGRGVGDPGGADDRLAGGRGRGRLVVPLGVVAHDRALVARGVDPVDPGPPLGGIDRAGGAEHDDGHAVAPGVEHRHGGVEQADIGMHGGGHRLAGHLGVAVGDRDGALLVQAEQHLRRLVAEEVDDRIVQAAVARAGIERDVGNFQRAQRVGDHVAAEARRVGAGQVGRALERAERWVGRTRRFFGGSCRLAFCSRHGRILGFWCREGAIEPDHEA